MSSPFEEDESHDTIDDLEVPAAGRDPRVRTLKEPPNIWDLVHENRKEFDPKSAFVGRLASRGYLVLAAVLLIAAGGGAIVFMWVGKSSGSNPASPVAESDRSSAKANVSPPSTPSNEIATSLKQTFTRPARVEPALSKTGKLNARVVSAGLSGVRAVPELSREDAANSTGAANLTVANPANKNRPQPLRSAAAGNRARTDYKDSREASTNARPRSDTDKNANSAVTRQEPDKTASSPVKTNSTPKAKVIPWPQE